MNENSELYQEPNAFSEALMDHEEQLQKLQPPVQMPPGELLFKQLNNDWLDQCPKDLQKDEELRLNWLRNHNFEKYLIALIILDILVLNDRMLENTGKNEAGDLEAQSKNSADLSTPESYPVNQANTVNKS